MKTLSFLTSVAAATGLLVSVASAQTPTATVAAPSSPAPAVAVPSSQATTRVEAERVIYAPQLPTAAELSEIAKAQGVTIDRIEQTASDVTISYRFNDGRTSTVAYRLLSDAGAATASSAPAAGTVVQGRTAPNVVYYTPAPTTTTRVVYYDRPAVYYDPFYYPWYGPVAFSVGFGFGHSYHGGHWSGHGHWGGRGGHGHRW